MKLIPRTLEFTIGALLASGAPSLKATDDPSIPPKSVPSSASVAPADVIPEAQTGTTSPDDKPIRLSPLVITESTQLSFQFSVRITRSQPENQLLAMYVEQVLPGSNAEAVQLMPGAMIVSIDGKPIGQYEATFRSGSELCKILVGRREGDEVTLVVIDPGETRQKKIVVTRRTRMQVRGW
jgi:hypothetical protein